MSRQRWSTLVGIGGGGLLVWLLVRQNWSELGPTLMAVGPGIVWIALFHLVPMVMDTTGWRLLLPRANRPGFTRLLAMRWYGESVNALLPAAQIGGDLLRGRLAYIEGVPGPAAAASIIADLALSVVTLAVFVVFGAILLGVSARTSLAVAMLVTGASLGAISLVGVYLFRRFGPPDRLLRWFTRHLPQSAVLALAGHASALHDALRGITTDRQAVAVSAGWQLAAWIAGTGEIWLALYFLGRPVSVVDAIVLESLLQAIRNAAFPVPGALGVQDGGLMLLAPLVGVGPDIGLAVSLLKRARETLLGVPGLAVLYLRSGPRQRSSA
jgi:putative membrane protein